MTEELRNLWRQRFNRYMTDLIKYGRLILNDHVSILLVVLIGFGGIGYRNVLLTLTAQQPIDHCVIYGTLAAIWGYVATRSTPIWLMSQADTSYLFPLGHEFKSYWLRGTRLGQILTQLVVLTVILLSYPLMHYVFGWDKIHLWSCLATGMLINYLMRVQYLAIYVSRLQWLFTSWGRLACWAVASGVFYCHIVGSHTWQLVILVSLVALGIAVARWSHVVGGHSEMDFGYAVQVDLDRQAHLYRVLSQFVDLPNQPATIDRLAFLDSILSGMTRMTHNQWGYLYLVQMFRHRSYRGIWVKILVFFAFFMIAINHIWFACLAVCLGFWMTQIQLMPLLHYYDKHPFHQLHPIHNRVQVRAFSLSCGWVLGLQWASFTILLCVSYGINVVTFSVVIIWVLVLLVILFGYIPWWNHQYHIKHRLKR